MECSILEPKFDMCLACIRHHVLTLSAFIISELFLLHNVNIGKPEIDVFVCLFIRFDCKVNWNHGFYPWIRRKNQIKVFLIEYMNLHVKFSAMVDIELLLLSFFYSFCFRKYLFSTIYTYMSLHISKNIFGNVLKFNSFNATFKWISIFVLVWFQ